MITPYIEGLPAGFDETLTTTFQAVQQDAQAGKELFGRLDKVQQKTFNELAELCLSHLIENPESAKLLGKFGAANNLYVIKIAEINGAFLRVHFCAEDGITDNNEDALRQGPANMNKLGTPHHHEGDCAGIISRGELVHHWFQEREGTAYTAGKIAYNNVKNPSEEYQFRSSSFVPHRQVDLEYIGSDAIVSSQGYWMSHEAIHVVSWPEPTISVFINNRGQQHESPIYHQGEVQEVIERPRHLTIDERNVLWGAFVDLAQKKLK